MKTFEEKILSAWGITDDLMDLLRLSEGEDIDDIQNVIIGLVSLYNHRFEELWREFETQLAEKKIRNTPTSGISETVIYPGLTADGAHGVKETKKPCGCKGC